jgi:hypothetical protein
MRKLIRTLCVMMVAIAALVIGGEPAHANCCGSVSVVLAPVMAPGGVNIRSGPGTGYNVVGTLGYGQYAAIHCTTTGEWIQGPAGWTNIWDYSSTNSGAWGYITDAWLYTGTNDPVEPAC